MTPCASRRSENSCAIASLSRSADSAAGLVWWSAAPKMATSRLSTFQMAAADDASLLLVLEEGQKFCCRGILKRKEQAKLRGLVAARELLHLARDEETSGFFEERLFSKPQNLMKNYFTHKQ